VPREVVSCDVQDETTTFRPEHHRNIPFSMEERRREELAREQQRYWAGRIGSYHGYRYGGNLGFPPVPPPTESEARIPRPPIVAWLLGTLIVGGLVAVGAVHLATTLVVGNGETIERPAK
jgi:hypothetical protein